MGWRLRIRHHTGFSYAGPVKASYNEARITPLTFPGQTTLDSRIEVTPSAVLWRYWDYWGAQVTCFDLHAEHDVLEVTGSSVVETWDALRSEKVRQRRIETLTGTKLTAVDSELADSAESLRGHLDPHATALAIAGWVGEQVEYVPGSTGVRTSAMQAWVQRKGVCQDIAHLTVGLLRSVGIPARYVSGYLHPIPHASVGDVGAGQSHAWVEWWVGEWYGFDPTNASPAAERHVVVARGRDYDDVPPLKGVYRGPASTAIGVGVEVERLA